MKVYRHIVGEKGLDVIKMHGTTIKKIIRHCLKARMFTLI